MITLVQLEYLIALDKHKSFSTAADHCFVTQPTLSMQIKKMESDLEVTLFDRAKKPVTPTDIGAIVIEQAKKVLAERNKIEELVQINKDTLTGVLRIGIIPSLSPYLLPSFIGKFAKKFEGIDVRVKELLSEDIMKAIDEDQIDVGIMATPLPKAGYNTTPLFYEKILLYCNRNHDFAHYHEVAIQQMKDKKLWLMSNGNCFRNQAINLCDLRESQEQSTFQYESASIETLIKLVDTEGGLTLLPELAVNSLTPKKQQFVKPFKNLDPVREISLISNRIFVKRRMIEALEKEIKRSINQDMLRKERGEIVEWS